MHRFRLALCLAAGTLIFAATLASSTSASAAELKRYAITPGGTYTYLPSPLGPGVPGGMPSAYELDFGVTGFFTVEYGETAARLLDVDLTLLGNQAIQENPPAASPVTSDRVATWLEARHLLKQPVAGPFDLYTDEIFPNLQLIDTLNGFVRLEGGFDSTPADGIGMQFGLNATLIPEPGGLQLTYAAGTLLIVGAWLLQFKCSRAPGNARVTQQVHRPAACSIIRLFACLRCAKRLARWCIDDTHRDQSAPADNIVRARPG
jgi:hypothetical protein